MPAVEIDDAEEAGQHRQELVQEDRQHDDERRAEEAAHDRAHAADDHHEQQPERLSTENAAGSQAPR